MSVRLEWSTAEAASVDAFKRHDLLADGNRVTSDYAITVGEQVVEGTAGELVQLLADALVKLADALERSIDDPPE